MNISYSQIEEKCNELHLVATKIKDILDNVSMIESRINGGSSWNGNASRAYSNKLSNISKNFADIYIEIENSILYMAKCSEGYQMIDKKVISEICANLNISEPNLGTSNIFNGG